jgi:phosphoenolpyruvate-protein phosphotransferase (PTS system enzyme I)
MNALIKKKRNLLYPKINTEERLNARAVSRGYAVGKVVCLHGRKRQFYRIGIDDSQVERELRRFRAAIRLAVSQLKKISESNNGNIKKTKADIFSAHLLFLGDTSLHAKVEKIIETEKVNAEWAVKTVTEEFIAQYKTIPDEHLRERHIDMEDVADRILTALGGSGKSSITLEPNSIIVAKELRPSTLIELAESRPQAIITENGGWTSHTFILAREMNLPAVTGVKRILRQVQNGDEVVVDGFVGEVILHPQKKTIANFKNAAESHQTSSSDIEVKKSKLKTLDGREIIIRANLDLPKGYAKARQFGAKGVGLYRSEFLFNQFKGFPNEQEQIEAYRKIARLVGAEGVRVRTFDLSVEQLADETEEREKNPALGLRAIRLGFTYLSEFRTQLRALLQASLVGNINLVLPMVTDVSEITETKQIIKREKKLLRKRKIEFGDLPIGAMIEVPSAVFTIDEIVSEVDFLCLGTNDLVQYILAVDRDNESVADWFRTLHPAVLRAIKLIFQAAEKKGIPVIVCGEMAGSPVYVPILLGLGATEISMNVSSIARVRKVISEIAVEETREIVRALQICRTADEIENAVTDFYKTKWSHLFPKDIFPPKRHIKS